MTKQEMIEMAWNATGMDYEAVKPHIAIQANVSFNFKEGGWATFSMPFKQIEGYNPDLLDIVGLKICRPKTLMGIENNNGWVKMESEADVPTEIGRYWVLYVNSDTPIMLEFSPNSSSKRRWYEEFSHYKMVEFPNFPLY